MVLIYQFDSETTDIAKELIQATIKDYLFSEIHFNLKFSSSTQEKEKYEEILSSLLEISDSIDGYFYLYMPFVSKIKKCKEILDQLKQKPFFQIICISKPIDDVLKKYDPKYMGSFPYCRDNLSYDKIRICLSNTSIYDEQTGTSVRDFSGLSYCFIKSDDFLNFEKKFVQINVKGTYKYCDFDDLYVKNMLK